MDKQRGAPRWLRPGAIAAIAFLNGTAEPTFGTQVPHLQTLLGLTTGGIGTVITGFPLGLLLGGVVGTTFGDRLGARRVLVASGILYWGSLIAIAAVLLAPIPIQVKPLAVGVLWTLGGAGNGGMDVAQNAEAAAVGPRGEGLRTLLFQAVQSFGTVVGAAVGGVVFGTAIPVWQHFMAAGGLALLVGVAAALTLPRVVPGEEEPPPVGRIDAVSVWLLFLLGLVGAASVVPLGIALNWSTKVGLELHASPALAGSALDAFAVAQLVGQLASAWLSERRRPRRTSPLGTPPRRGVRPASLAFAGSIVAAMGLGLLVAVALSMPRPLPTDFTPAGWMLPLTTLGFMLLGLGTSPVPAMAQRAAFNIRVRDLGRVRFGPHRRQGIVTVIIYGAMTGAPALVGWLAQITAWGILASLTMVIAVCALALVLLCRVLRYAQVNFGGMHGRFFTYHPQHALDRSRGSGVDPAAGTRSAGEQA